MPNEILIQGIIMSEDEAFNSLFCTYLEEASLVLLKGYPFYEVTDGISEVHARIIDPFVEAEVENTFRIKSATPKRVLEILKRELAKKKELKTKEDEPERFARILLLCAQQLSLLINNPMQILKIKTLLGLTKHLYSSLRIEVDELKMLNQALNSGLLAFELFPGRGPAYSVELMWPNGEKRRYSFIRFKEYKLVKNNERKPETSIQADY